MNNKYRICGIDPSITSTGISIIDIEDSVFKLVFKTSLVNKKSFKNRWEKKEVTRELFEHYLKDKIKDIDFFIFEDYSFGSKGYLADAGEMIGQFKHFLWKHKKPFDRIPPATVKKLIGGDGRAEKDVVAGNLKNYISNIKDYKFNNFDETDAVAVVIAYLININEPTKPKPRRKSKGSPKPARRNTKVVKSDK